jgi:hypothetical protein
MIEKRERWFMDDLTKNKKTARDKRVKIVQRYSLYWFKLVEEQKKIMISAEIVNATLIIVSRFKFA